MTVHEVPLVEDFGALKPDLLEFNLWLLRERGDRLVSVLSLLAAPGALPGVYFCSTGKDRTGLITALLLSTLGAGDEDVTSDYAVSETRLPLEYADRAVARARAGGLPEDQIKGYKAYGLASPAPVMGGTLNYLRREHGGAESFLRAHGLTVSELDALRAALLQRA